MWFTLLAWANGSIRLRMVAVHFDAALDSYAVAYLAEAVAPIREYVEAKLPHTVGYDSMHLEEVQRLLGELECRVLDHLVSKCEEDRKR